MSSFIRRILLSTALVFLALSGNAQDGIIQLRFTATEASGRVFLDWTMDLGQTCDGIDILRSTDGLNFMEVGNIPGICGSPFDTVRYSFTDESPIPNQVNYYRLFLGTLGPTQTVSVEIIDLEGAGYQVRPNPVSDEGLVYFNNPRSALFRLILFSSQGALIKSYTTRDEFFQLNLADVPAGHYFFRIETDEAEPRSIGKILVVR
jgi:hypothetical protein